MTCEGCSGAIDRVLKKLDGNSDSHSPVSTAQDIDRDPHGDGGSAGINSYEVSLESQEVIVRTREVSFEDVLAKIKKTGKEVKSGEIVGGGPQPV